MTPEICVPSFPPNTSKWKSQVFLPLHQSLWVHIARIHCQHVGMAVQSFTVFLLASNTAIQWPGIQKLWAALALHLCDKSYSFWHPLESQLWCLPIRPAAVHHYVIATFCIFYMLLLLPSLCIDSSPLNGSFSTAGKAWDLPFYLQHLTKSSLLPWSLGNLCRTKVKRIRASRHILCFLHNSNRF